MSLIPFKKETGFSLSEGHAVGPAVGRRHLTAEVRARSQLDVGFFYGQIGTRTGSLASTSISLSVRFHQIPISI
jgi:hypothetical protein